MKFPFPVFPNQACKMAASAVSSGERLADKCLPEYISTAMKTLERAQRAQREREESLESEFVPKAIRAAAQSGFS